MGSVLRVVVAVVVGQLVTCGTNSKPIGLAATLALVVLCFEIAASKDKP